MKYSVIISALVVILVGGSVFLGFRITNLVDQVYELQSSLNSLQTDFQSLTTQYNTLKLSYESLEAENKELESRVISLSASYHMINLANRDLQNLLDECESVPSSSNSTNTSTQ